MEFQNEVIYRVSGRDDLSFSVNGDTVVYTVRVGQDTAQKGRFHSELPLPNGNVIMLNVVGMMTPNIREQKWTLLGEGLTEESDLVLRFEVKPIARSRKPWEKQQKKKKKANW